MNVVVTADGSRTLTADEQGTEIYHSRHGALQESLYVFIHQGLEPFLALAQEGNPSPISILEVGFGTGLNALLALQWSLKNARALHYTGLEPKRLDINLVSQLNYPDLLSLPSDAFMQLHAKSHLSRPPFEGEIATVSLQDYEPNSGEFDIVWFDAFSPRFQPELWEISIFQKLFTLLKPNGKLVTYSAKGDVQRALKGAGFLVEKLPGPPGKREMLRGTRPA